MRIEGSARRHGIVDADILHAWNNAHSYGVFEYDAELRMFVIGPARNGADLELVAVPGWEPVRIIHADRLRPSFRNRINRR